MPITPAEQMHHDERNSVVAHIVNERENISGLLGAVIAYVECLHNLARAETGLTPIWFGPVPTLVLARLREEWVESPDDRSVLTDLAAIMHRCHEEQAAAIEWTHARRIERWEDAPLDPDDTLEVIADYPDEVERIRRIQQSIREHPVYLLAATISPGHRQRFLCCVTRGPGFDRDAAEEFYRDEICRCDSDEQQCPPCQAKRLLEELAHAERMKRLHRGVS